VHWYPFATPAVAAATSAALHHPINEAYLEAAAVLAGLALFGLAAFMYASGGTAGLAAFPVLLLLGAGWPGLGAYPFHTALLPFTLFMAAAGAAFRATGRDAQAGGGRWSHGVAGFLNGALGLWHGASFVAASAASGALIVAGLVRGWRDRAARREALVRAGVLVAAVAVPFALLVVPQLLRYGTFQQSDAARLYLEPWYLDGNAPEALFRLALAPRGLDLAWLAAFVAALVAARDRRAAAVPLLVAWIVTKTLAHAGFVVNDAAHPTLAAAARAVLVAPPHTLHHVAETTFGLMKAWVVAVAAAATARTFAAERLRRTLAAATRGAPRISAPWVVVLALSLAAAARVPAPEPPYVRPVDAAVVRFAEQLSALAAPGEAVVGANGLLHMAPIKVLWFDSAPHANPYVATERERALGALERGAAAGDRPAMATVLRRYRVRYVVGDGVLARTCGERVVLLAPDGTPVVRLDLDCGLGPAR
jgi:hypothetical protein